MRLLRLQVHPRGFRRQALIRWFRRGLLAGLALVCAYLVAALLGALIALPVPDSGAPRDRSVLLVHGPIHYDFLLPLDAVTRARFAPLAAEGLALDHVGARWLVVGWGGRSFYTSTPTWRDLSLRALARSVFGDASVMHVGLAGTLPEDLRTRQLDMTAAQYDALLEAIWDSFTLTPGEDALAAYGPFDLFFPARGRFHLGRTCNVWLGEMIRAAGLRFGAWTPLPGAVSLSWWLYQSR